MRTFALLLCLSFALCAQQLQPNTAAATCLLNGQGPLGFSNFTQIGSTGTLTVAVQGGASLPYSLFFGSLSPVSLPVAGTQFVDFNLFAPFSTVIDGIGFGLTPSALPSVFGNTGPLGSAAWSFPLNPATIGFTGAFQAVVADPTNPALVALSGAPQFEVTPFGASVVGDDTLGSFTLPFPVTLYGQVFNSIVISTNGMVKFGGAPTFADLGENSANFTSGAVGGAAAGSGPIIAAHWDDLDVGNNASQELTISQNASGAIALSWVNVDYYPNTPVGTISMTIDSANSTFFFDFTSFTGNQQRGLIGISDGGSAAATPVQIDLATFGSVNTYTSAGTETLFQNFNLNEPFAETMDMAGLSMTFIETGIGTWVVL